jgi:hypothetical protein
MPDEFKKCAPDARGGNDATSFSQRLADVEHLGIASE